MRVLVFGASSTQGFWDTKGGWVQRLRTYYDTRYLRNNRQGDSYSFFNLGVDADTTKDILNRFESDVRPRLYKKEKPIIIISTGGNNTIIESDGKNRSTPEEFKEDLNELVVKAKKFSNNVILVGLAACDESRTTPVSWEDINYTNERLSLFDKVVQEVGAEQMVKYIAIFDRLQAEFKAGKNIFEDGLHPNDAGHELISQFIRPELDKLLP